MKLKYILSAFALFALTFTVAAQNDNRKSEAYYQIEAKFIAAGGELAKGKVDEAIAMYKELLKEPEAAAAVQFELSRIYDAKEDNLAAIKAAKAAVAADPANEWYKKQLGDLYQKAGNDDAAAELYGELVAAHPDNDYYYYKQAYFLVRANQPKDALKVYDALEQKRGINEELTRRRHTLYLGLGDEKNAEKEILRLVERYPQDLDYRHFLAGFYEQNGQKNKAKQVYEYIIGKNPTDADALIALAEDKQPTGNDTEYLSALKAPFANPELAIDAKIVQIIPLIQQVADTGDKFLADELLELSAILEETHDDAKAYSIAGDLYFYTNRKAKAVEKYEQTIERNETVLPVWEQYLTALKDTGKNKELLARSEDALDVFPNQGSIHLLNAVGYGRNGKPADALSALQQAKMMSFNNPPLEYGILTESGKQYAASGKPKEAHSAFQKAIEMNAQGTDALTGYAAFLAEQNENLGEAEKIAKKATDLKPDNAEAQAAYAAVFLAKKDYKNAAAWYAKAAENMTYDNPLILEKYGDALLKNGDSAGAVTQWKKAMEAGGNAARINRKIEET